MDVDKELCPIMKDTKIEKKNVFWKKKEKKKRTLWIDHWTLTFTGMKKERIVLRNEWIETYGGADIESGSVLQQELAAGSVSTGGGQVEGGPVLTIPQLRVSSPVQEQLQTAVRQKQCQTGDVDHLTTTVSKILVLVSLTHF